MLGNHLEEYIVPTGLASPQVAAFVIIHEAAMLQNRKTTRTHILKERFNFPVILADVLIGLLQVWTGVFWSCICLLFYLFFGDLQDPLGTFAISLQQGRSRDGWLPVQCSGWFLELTAVP